jgi:hypothetical protein
MRDPSPRRAGERGGRDVHGGQDSVAELTRAIARFAV